jgi:glycosyltransferase involved in cell wall biosynthesis
VPVIASDVGGLHDLIDDGKCGFLVPPANAKAITDYIILLAGDRSLLADLKIGARKQAEEKLDANIAYGHYETTLRKAIETKNLKVD